MSFVVNILYQGKDGSAQKFAQEMQESGLVEKIRAQVGNKRYEYYQPLDNPEAILLIDEWENKQALDDHHKSPMMADIAKLRKKYHLKMQVKYFDPKDSLE